ncbi:MAG: cytochrome c oxidase assembly protein subunit 15 [Gammaproteobacteria bacterium]|jgi:cytochrome c oxidase assembly protein subunit 15
MSDNKIILNLLRFACVLAFIVIVIGAYTRLSDSGLGCPDWPGCYGKLIVPNQAENVNEAYPERPLEHAKAWTEMAHRYAASSLGLLILIIACMSWTKSSLSGMRLFASALLLLVIFQGMLGMWTVTLLLKPVIVLSHLIGGLTILSLLYWSVLRYQSIQHAVVKTGYSKLLPLVIAGMIVLAMQILLGGWTSTNYAALACPDFPTCQGVWWPTMDFNEGFILWRGLGIDYEGGVLHGSARTAIHMAHRIGALITFFTILTVAVQAIRSGIKNIKLTGLIVLIILIAQVSLGIANIKFYLPLSVAVAHNGVAALLLLSLVSLLHLCLPVKK